MEISRKIVPNCSEWNSEVESDLWVPIKDERVQWIIDAAKNKDWDK